MVYKGAPCCHEIALCINLLKDPNLLFFEPRWKISYYQVKNESGGGEEEKIKDEEVPKTKKVKMKVNVGQSKKVIPLFNFFL